jgi:hypothetical protein
VQKVDNRIQRVKRLLLSQLIFQHNLAFQQEQPRAYFACHDENATAVVLCCVVLCCVVLCCVVLCCVVTKECDATGIVTVITS